MKKNALVNILSLSAILSTNPVNALAKEADIKNPLINSNAYEIVKSEFTTFTANEDVYWKNEDGSHTKGKLVLEIKKSKFTPSSPNRITAEMVGSLKFVDEAGNDQYSIIGDDNQIILDLIDSRNNGKSKTYQIYGCSSTDSCQTEKVELGVYDNEYSLYINLGNDEIGLHFLHTQNIYDNNGQIIGTREYFNGFSEGGLQLSKSK